MIYDLTIVGGGPAGIAAGVYAARKRLKTLFITYDFGGQSTVSPEIKNWIGTKSISGNDLAHQLEDHLREYEGENLTITTGRKVKKVEQKESGFTITDDRGEVAASRTVLVTAGSYRRKLTVPGAAEFDQKGLTYCASCDGPVFSGQDVVVIGGGNAGFETAGQLLAYAKSVTLLHHTDKFKADKITVEKLLQNPKMTALTEADITEVKGDKFVTGITYRDKKTGETKDLSVGGVFVEIGFIPNTDFIKDLVTTNNFGAIVVDAKNQQSKTLGIWAAGDCTDALYHQNNIAAGDGVKAVEDIYVTLHLK
ncbi:MAG: FAD-dependent oxidoreductase [Candidatus Paceibacterota bacterium]